MTFKVKEKHGPGVAEAFKMLDTFASVGVEAFDITHTNIDEDKRGFRRQQSIEETRRSLPYLLDSAPRRQNNVIIRPHPPRPCFSSSSTISAPPSSSESGRPLS